MDLWWLLPPAVLVMVIAPVVAAIWIAQYTGRPAEIGISLWAGLVVGAFAGPLLALALGASLEHLISLQFPAPPIEHGAAPTAFVGFLAVWLVSSLWIGVVAGLAAALLRLGCRTRAGAFLLTFGGMGAAVFVVMNIGLTGFAWDIHDPFVSSNPLLWSFLMIPPGAWLLWRKPGAQSDAAR
jgi:hypothetical protein